MIGVSQVCKVGASGTLLALFALLMVPSSYVQLTTPRAFGDPREFLFVALGWGFITVHAGLRAVEGKPIFSGGADSWARRLAGISFLWIVLSGAIGYHPHATWGYVASLLTYLLVAQTTMDWLADNAQRRNTVLAMLATLVGFQTVVGIMQFLKLPLGKWAMKVPELSLGATALPGGFWPHDALVIMGMTAQAGRPTGTLGNENYLAELLALALPVLFAWIWGVKRSWIKMAGLLAMIPTLAVFISTGTRAALLGMLTGAILAAVVIMISGDIKPREWVRSSRGKLTLALGLVVMLGIGGVAGGRLVSKLEHWQHDQAIEARLVNWRVGAALWQERPLTGVGLGNYKLVNLQKLQELHPAGVPAIVSEQRFYQLHNEPLQVLVELGVVGLLLLLGVALLWFREVAHNQALPVSLRFGLIWGITAVLVAGLFGFPFHNPTTALVIVLLLALGLAKSHATQSQWVLKPRIAFVLAVVLLTGVAGSFVVYKFHWPMFLAHRYEFSAEVLNRAEKHEASAIVYALADRHHRFRGSLRVEELDALVKAKQYTQALTLIESSDKEGLGVEAMYYKGQALKALNRKDEARAAWLHVKGFFAPTHQLHQWAVRELAGL